MSPGGPRWRGTEAGDARGGIRRAAPDRDSAAQVRGNVYDPGFRNGVRVAAGDLAGGGVRGTVR